MESYPKISIVTPNYNLGQFLEETIKSVLDQNYPNLEYFVIDGGSTDNSLEIIKKYESRLSGFISESDTGMYDAVQKGMEKCTGEIITYLNSDDILLPGCLHAVARLFSDIPDMEWLQGGSVVINDLGHIVSSGTVTRPSKYDYMTPNLRWLGQEGTFWTKDLWLRAGGYISKDYKLASDFELWNRFFDHGKLYNTQNMFCGFRMRPGQLHSEFGDYIGEVNTILAKKKYPPQLLKKLNRKLFFIRLIKAIPGLRSTEFAKNMIASILESSPLLMWDRNIAKYRIKKLPAYSFANFLKRIHLPKG